MGAALRDKATGEPLAHITQTTFCRGDGDLAGRSVRHPSRTRCLTARLTWCAGCRRRPMPPSSIGLSGDYNPLHSDLEVAAKAVSEADPPRAGDLWRIRARDLRSMCGYDATKLRSLSARFTAPVYPGETFEVRMWRDGDVVSFETRSVERDILAIGSAEPLLVSRP